MSFLSDFFQRFTTVVRSIIDFILPIAESEAGKIISAGLPIAVTIVSSLASKDLPGQQKRDQAVAQLKTQLASQGIAAAESIGTSTLNFIVETALQHLNAK